MAFGVFRKRTSPRRYRNAGIRHALNKLRAQHQRLQARFDLIRQGTSDGLWDMEVTNADVTAADNPFWWSDQFRRLLGFRDEIDFPNVLGSWSDLLHPDDRERTLQAFRAHIEDLTGGTPYDISYRLRCRNGQFRWFRALGHTQRSPDGRALRCAGALTDLTDRNALISLKRYAETIIATLPVGLVVLDENLRIRSANNVFCVICGCESESVLVGRDIETVLPEDGLCDGARAILEGGASRHGIEFGIDGKRLRVALAHIEIEDGGHGLLGLVEDITEEYLLREQAHEHAERHRDQASLLDKARDAIIVRSLDDAVLYWNKGAERLYGWRAEDVLGQQILGTLYGPGTVLNDAFAAVQHDGEWCGELTQRCRDGSEIMVEERWTLVRDTNGNPKAIFTIGTDISERKKSDAKIRSLALYDTLTGLPNRTLLAQRFEEALATTERHRIGLTVLFIDLNRFKEINDINGHGAGDDVLVEVARRFRHVLREDELLARLAGDEFVVLAEGKSARTGVILAERLEGTLVEPIMSCSSTFSVSVSIGIATYPADGTTMEDMLKHADIAMYRAKAGGGGHMSYAPQMSEGLAERMELAQDLGKAMEANALQLHYQPQVNIATGELVGAEVLLRWHDPARGWISPATFIPIAEARGMIGALGKWVLRSACAQLKAWREAGLCFPGRLWVNLSVQQLEDAYLIDDVRNALDDAGVRPECIGLELTESGLMTNVEHATATMDQLKRAGLAISIDDFGTGYSSLAYLKRLPADKLKIDISFVRDMLVDRQDYAIVTMIIGMARTLGLQVVAEGVEQQAQADALYELGCGEAQGFWFGRPQPPEAFETRWLSSR